MLPRRERIDVLVIGGGPAGSAAAITLSSLGVSVAMLERSEYESQRIGETLPPKAKSLLCRLGVWDQFTSDGHLPSPGNVSIWGSNSPAERDFLFDAAGDGWHLDRVRFDRMLAQSSAERGAKLFTGVTIKNYSQDAFGKWTVLAAIRDEEMIFEADYLILATGRKAKIRLPLKGKQISDRLVGVVGFLDLKSPIGEADHRMMIESDEYGWWYSSLLPHGKMVLAYMTDSDLLPKSIQGSTSEWGRLMGSTSYTADRAANCIEYRKIQVHPANSYSHTRFFGKNWVAIGDLAFAFDPLSSSGIVNAIESGIDSAKAIIEGFQGKNDPFERYIFETMNSLKKYLNDKQAYYDIERRWPASRFWQRRRRISC